MKNAALKIETLKIYLLSAVIFRIILEISCCIFIGKINVHYIDFGFNINVYPLKYIESWVVYMVLVYCFPRQLEKPSDFLMCWWLFMYISPLTITYGLLNQSREHLYIMLLGVLFVWSFRRGSPIKLPIVRGGQRLALAISLAGTIVVTIWMLTSGSLAYFNINFSRVYEFRTEVGNIINQGSMAYVNIWAAKVFGPLLLAYSLWYKKYFIAFCVFAVHFFWFGISSHKSYLFFPLIIVFVHVMFRNSRALVILPVTLAMIVIVCLLLHNFFDYDFASNLFIRRVFFIPTFLTFSYYDYFSQNEFIYWSNSILKKFLTYPYHLTPSYRIGDYIGTGAHANNSFLATGYMHAGIPGIIFYGICVGLLFRLLDSIAFGNMPIWFAVTAIIVPCSSLLISADLFTALLSHGVGLAVILLYLSVPNDNNLTSDNDSISLE